MAGALPDKYAYRSSTGTEDMGQTSEATANDSDSVSSNPTSSRLEEFCPTSDEGNVELLCGNVEKLNDFPSLGSASESNEHPKTELVGYVNQLELTDRSTEKIERRCIDLKWKEENDTLQEKLDKYYAMLQQCANENKQLKKQVASMESRTKYIESQAKDRKKGARDKTKICDRFQLQQSALENNQLKQKLTSMQCSMSTHIEDLESQLEQYSNENKQLKTKVAVMESHVLDIESQNCDVVKRATDMHQTAVKKYTDATNMVSQLQKELTSKETEKQMMLEKAYEDMDRLKNENQSSVDENAVLHDMVKRGTDIIEEFQEKISTQDGHLRQMQTELTEAQETIHTLENEHPSSGDRVSIEGADSVDYRKGLINKPVNIKVPHPGLHHL